MDLMTKHWSKPSGTTIFYCAWNTSLSELNWGAKNLMNQMGKMSFFFFFSCMLIVLICIPFCKVNCIYLMYFLASAVSNTVRFLWLSNDYGLPKTVKISLVSFFFPFACETGLNVLYILKDLAYKEKSRLKALQNSSCADVYDLWAQN